MKKKSRFPHCFLQRVAVKPKPKGLTERRIGFSAARPLVFMGKEQGTAVDPRLRMVFSLRHKVHGAGENFVCL
ncbi:MAG: hypothetical protein LBD55_11410 [Treponema sp.]|jgi:hypothetical protein|nr:hypothetical protein [Treponema sp.]